jgi:hypothetical protein
MHKLVNPLESQIGQANMMPLYEMSKASHQQAKLWWHSQLYFGNIVGRARKVDR